jgi:hypothetical protein
VLAEVLTDQAREQVVAAAGRVTDDEINIFALIEVCHRLLGRGGIEPRGSQHGSHENRGAGAQNTQLVDHSTLLYFAPLLRKFIRRS